ncbi:MAG TPA: hypothetical protein VIJ29_02830 [Candidatus Paceibacterota bacterium]
MEQSEKEKLLEEIRLIIREEVSPVLDIIMTYLDIQFDIFDETFHQLSGGIVEVLGKLTEILERRL